jgi:magnesium transporter
MSDTLAGIVQKIVYRPRERMVLFRSLSTAEQSSVFTEVSPYIQQQILNDLTVRETVDLLDQLDLHAAEIAVSRIKDTRRRSKIITQLKTDIREKIEYFLRFHPKATLGLMHLNYLLVPEVTTIGEAGDAIDGYHTETGRFPLILVQRDGELQGEVPMTVLVREKNSEPLGDFVQQVPTITYQANIEDIVALFSDSDHKKVIVLDHDKSVLGIVYADDVRELFSDLPAEALYSISGVDSAERPLDSAKNKFFRRYKWLIVNLGTAFLAGSVILSYQETINQLTILSMYIPIVTGMGGNAASQSFAVMLRGVTLGAASMKVLPQILAQEVRAGLYNGLLIGSIVAIISVVINASWLLGVVVGLTMILQHMIAAAAGTTVPLFIKHIGKDPASISNIFISTVTDVAGIGILLTLGTIILL